MIGYTDRIVPVFAGPSLAGQSLAEPFRLYPPAAAGDVLRLLNGPPCTVVLIDGVFDARPAVWHKEVLVLLARGFRVIGASSMGALRAAELRSFGMIGVGSIYRAYASGHLTDDDEVAVIHAPAELGAGPLSVAQVDVRATLARAVRARAICPREARLVRSISKQIYYADRTWIAILDIARGAGIEISGFEPWLTENDESLKNKDACSALLVADDFRGCQPAPFPMPPRTQFLVSLAEWADVRL